MFAFYENVAQEILLYNDDHIFFPHNLVTKSVLAIITHLAHWYFACLKVVYGIVFGVTRFYGSRTFIFY